MPPKRGGGDRYYEINRIIDMHNTPMGKAYRVRWANYEPKQDVWLYVSHFNEHARCLIDACIKKYEKLMKQEELLHEGIPHNADCDYRIKMLTEEVEKVIGSRTVRGQKQFMVLWKGSGRKTSWETEGTLIHAYDVLVEYIRSKGGQVRHIDLPQQHHAAAEPSSSGGECVARAPAFKTASPKKRAKLSKKEEKLASKLDSEAQLSSVKSAGETDVLNYDMLEAIPVYQGSVVRKVFKSYNDLALELSAEEFIATVEKDDFKSLLMFTRRQQFHKISYTKLFLAAVRRGQRSIAMMLATYVCDLTAFDEWGETALTLSARINDVALAYGLLVMGVPVNCSNRQGETALEIAKSNMNHQYVDFMQKYQRSMSS